MFVFNYPGHKGLRRHKSAVCQRLREGIGGVEEEGKKEKMMASEEEGGGCCVWIGLPSAP